MLHIIKLIKRRFPNASGKIITTLVLVSASALAIGVGFLLLRQ
ncbi:MAG: hypothetical protein O3C40_26495 [Planctomycetota bacterium]|nr:hypothetical protein [Planctomycetota bacterium]